MREGSNIEQFVGDLRYKLYFQLLINSVEYYNRIVNNIISSELIIFVEQLDDNMLSKNFGFIKFNIEPL